VERPDRSIKHEDIFFTHTAPPEGWLTDEECAERLGVTRGIFTSMAKDRGFTRRKHKRDGDFRPRYYYEPEQFGLRC